MYCFLWHLGSKTGGGGIHFSKHYNIDYQYITYFFNKILLKNGYPLLANPMQLCCKLFMPITPMLIVQSFTPQLLSRSFIYK
jgi:hypothetical protein